LLLGDIVMDVREAVTDLPQQTLPVPTLQTGQSIVACTLPPGNYLVVVTQRNNWGETIASAESGPTVVDATHGLLITSPLLPGATTIRAYLTLAGGVAGSEQQFIESSVSPFTISTPLQNSGTPPTRNTAYLPDMDGDAISASSLFRWINRGLELASQVAGGLFDYSGVSTVSGMPQYIVSGQYKRISTVWYDGYPLAMDDAGNFFRRNTITASVLASVATSLLTDRMMLEVWPQPSRTAAQTTLAVALAAGDTQATLTSTAGFLLTDGFVNFGGEICSYNGIAGNVLQNLVRALGGTVAAAAPIGTPVSELNLFFQGWKKYAPNFQPGQSNVVVPVPVDWNSALFKYGLGRAKLAEQSVEDFTKLEQDLVKMFSDWNRTNKVTTGPRQVGEQTNSLEVLPSFGGGWVSP
jgi:hypothetical protein